MYGGSGGMFFGGGVMWIVWIVLLVVFVYILKDIFSAGNRGASKSNALEILKERYARGEIDETEFKRRKQELE